MTLTPKERRNLLTDLVKHVLAGGIVAGFFGVVLAALLGFVDIKDPAVTAFIGTALGYVASEMKKITDSYFPEGADRRRDEADQRREHEHES